MNNRLLCFMLMMLCSCATLPVLGPLKESDRQFNLSDDSFLKEKYRLIHSIRAILPNNETVIAIGVTVADPYARSVDAVLMTVEGFVLFDVSYKNNSFIINRSVPQFGGNNFAESLINDINIIYFPPDFKMKESGKLKENYVTRYYCRDNSVTDIFLLKNGKSKIIKYDSENDKSRTVNISSLNSEGIPGKIELIAHGFFGYTLNMELIEFEKI